MTSYAKTVPGTPLKVVWKHELSSGKKFSIANVFLLLFKILYKRVLNFLSLQKLIMFYAFMNVDIFAGKKPLQLRWILIFSYIWQVTTILFVKSGLNLQQFIFITQKWLKIPDTIHLDFALADNLTCTQLASANKQYFITTNFIVDVATSFK